VYYFLTEALKNRFIRELRNFWSYHPKYRDTIVDFIQTKYSFRERPQTGIILKTSSANHVSLAADNFQGTLWSHAHLAKVQNYPGLAVEWIREDQLAIRANQGEFPSAPGIYYIDIQEDGKSFYVDPLIDVFNENVMQLGATEFLIENVPIHAGSQKLWVMPGNVRLYEGVNYTIDPATGEITLFEALNAQNWLAVDYRYPAESTGPWALRENFANKNAIPGVTLAFGRRVEGGDRLAVVISRRRQPAAQEFGGRWDISLDFDVIARDEHAQMEITDMTIQYIWGVLRSHLSTDGIEIMDVSMGGETEEAYDENADDWYFNASFSVTCQTDWALYVPLNATIRRVETQSLEQAMENSTLTDAELAQAEQMGLVVVENLGLDLKSWDDPFFAKYSKTYEVIK